MKRFIFLFFSVLVLCFSLLPYFTVSAEATTGTSDNQQEEVWINALDYASFMSVHGNTYYNANALGNLNIPIYTSSPIYNIDVLFSSDFPVTNFRVYSGSNYWTFTVYPLGDGRTYRAVGRAGGIGNSSVINGQPVLTFKLASSSTSGYITFHQVHYSVVNTMRYGTNVSSQFTFDGMTPKTANFTGNPVTIYPGAPTNINNTGYIVWTDLTNWQSYDYIDVVFLLHRVSVSSVAVVYGDQTLPFTSNIISPTPTTSDNVFVSVRVDLRGLVRNSGVVPSIFISGSGYVNTTPEFSILEASGLLIAYDIDPLYIYFESVRNSILSGSNSIIDALGSALGGTGQGTVIKDQTQQQAGQISDAVADFGSYEKPSSSDLNAELQFSDIISPEALSGSTSFLTALFNIPSLMQIVTLSLMLALLATIVFGKR